ncbi:MULTISPECIES: endo-beta-N-acetylglucosaminidase [Streptomyces]|uniref:endo-beta-N-acetylglucosaminidase n=1 Tax=Streptomyces TaxID=1883 RepID=UPI00163C7F36|nr:MULTISPECIES: endo-beta-N-acetylglucosaminidase [Streptomyces]MBC2876259.1 endo-beta-N-acetylglucosaminidase [Streptomyces sp. TYQ1024]UKW28111.1 endo-beta-N-acetylglucosaminidase [Streptomyces sp. TYQ1024]
MHEPNDRSGPTGSARPTAGAGTAGSAHPVVPAAPAGAAEVAGAAEAADRSVPPAPAHGPVPAGADAPVRRSAPTGPTRHSPAADGPARRAVLAAGFATAFAAPLARPSAARAAGRAVSPGGGAAGGGAPSAGAAHAPPDLQPYAAYWFPDTPPPGTPPPGVVWRSLARWRPEDDPDLPFNRSSVPLAPRFTPPPRDGARAGQARISALVSFAPTSGHPSQGGPTADHYAFTHWAHLDELVFWGGSSGEGLILAPTAPVVDAAHRHGVPVLGTVFLPPAAFGGRLEWTRDLLRRGPDGGFPLAGRLAAVARAYGFDGWFLNAETEGGDARLGADMRDFVARLRATGLRVTWYDALAISGDVAWQNELNDRNDAFFRAAGTMFVNFGWTRGGLRSSGERAEAMGRDRYELWAGVDVEARGRDTRVDWDAVLPPDRPHVTSLGLYRPEWTWKQAADRSPAAFHTRDDRFWTLTDGTWRAPAASVADRSTLTALPFATVFNTGHGLGWYERGRPVPSGPWHHLGLQDRLPGRRRVTAGPDPAPSVGYDFADAWHGGGSLLVAGPLPEPATVELYAARLPLSPSTIVELTYRTDAGSAPVRVEFVADAGDGRAGVLAAGRAGPAWTTVTVRAGALLRGRARGTLRTLGVRLTAPGGGPVRWRLGRLAVRDGAPRPPGRPGRPEITAAAVRPGGTAALRLAWGASPRPVRHYLLHQRLPGGGVRFLGGTCGHASYVPELRRTAGEAVTCVEVRAVDELYTSSAPAVVRFRWPNQKSR